MAIKCPKCGREKSYDYRSDIDMWECVWEDCGHRGTNLIRNEEIRFCRDCIHAKYYKLFKYCDKYHVLITVWDQGCEDYKTIEMRFNELTRNRTTRTLEEGKEK